MKLEEVTDWIDRLLEVGRIHDVSNNGLQIDSVRRNVTKVAFSVDASVKAVEAAAAAGAGLLVVHHGISWGGGIERLTGGVCNVVRAAIRNDIALYAVHLPLDLNAKCGNNWEIARHLRLVDIVPAFEYHGVVIGLTGVASETGRFKIGETEITLERGEKIGVCSGGAGGYAAEAKALGCTKYLTGEADWGEVIAAENAEASMITAGHYETETFGVKGLMREMTTALPVAAVFLDRTRNQ